jgi:hypothetical protein
MTAAARTWPRCYLAMGPVFSSACSNANCGHGARPPRCGPSCAPSPTRPGIRIEVRIYPPRRKTARGVVVLGARVSGERQDLWIITLARYTDAMARQIGPRSARGNALVSGRFRETGQKALAGTGCSGEDGATDTKRPGHGHSGKASVAQPDTEGIETARPARRTDRRRARLRRKAQPDTEGIETRS